MVDINTEDGALALRFEITDGDMREPAKGGLRPSHSGVVRGCRRFSRGIVTGDDDNGVKNLLSQERFNQLSMR